jgi:hypothetical protein
MSGKSRPWRGNSHRRREIKRQLFGQHTHRPCCFCERPLSFDAATLEHVIPRSKRGRLVLANLKISCSPCNRERGDGDFEAFKARKREQMALGPLPPLPPPPAPRLPELDSDLHTTQMAAAAGGEPSTPPAPRRPAFQQDDRLVEALRSRK